MEYSRQEYPALLAILQPEQAVNILNDRISLINSVNTSIADFLQERRRIEERYAAELRKLAKRPQQDGGAALGIFQLPWQRIVAGTENLAQSHETLASKIETDVENPLKQYATKSREMQAIGTVQGNLASIAREVTRAREKADKLNAKGSRKAGDASSSVEDASREWESQAPFVYEQLQAADESRVNHLRDVLTQLQTHEADQIERNRASAESCLNALLNIETADEIKTFAAKVQQGGGMLRRRQSSATGEPRPSSSGIVPPVPPPPRNQDQRNRTTPNEDRLAPLPETTPHKSKMGGLKRLGTVMRRKSAAPPPPQTASEKKKEKSRSFAPFRRGDSSSSFHDLESTGQDLTPVTSQSARPIPRQDTISSETPSRPNVLSEPVATLAPNGVSQPFQSPSDELQQPLAPTNAYTNQYPSQETQPITATPLISSATTSNMATSPGIPSPTNTGYELEDSSRNLTIRDEPIREDASEAQLAMNNMANQLRLQAQNSGMSRVQGSVRGRRDVRNTMFVPSNQEVPGFGPTSGSSLSSVASPISSIPAAPAVLNSNAVESAPRQSLSSAPILEDQATASDVNSIHSAQSLTGLVHHPDLHDVGLNASIVETVSTWFSETGIIKSSVVGEVAFAHITSPTSTPVDRETVRLQNFQVLEKVAANPTFVIADKSTVASAEDQAGVYTLDVSAIRRSRPIVGLKYQLHLEESNLGRYSPLLLTPAWQIVEGQASMILLYNLNPAFSMPSPISEIVLKNVVINVSLDIKDIGAGKPTSAMMAPTQHASFRRKAGSVVWRFPELKVKTEQERLLVRFLTEGGIASKGGIEIKFEMPDMSAGGLGIERLGSGPIVPEVDPFADEEERKSSENAASSTGEWHLVPTKRMLVTGRYSAL